MTIFLSHSQRDTLLKCGWMYALERVHKKPSRPHWSTLAGTAFHKTTEILELRDHGVDLPEPDVLDELQIALDEELKRGNGVWTEADVRAGGRKSREWPNAADRAYMEHALPEWLAMWRNWRQAVPWDLWITPEGEPAIEVGFEFTIKGDVKIRGFIDRVFVDRASGQLIVVDYKTGSRDPKSDGQLGVYRRGLAEKYGIEPNYGTFYMARKAVTHQLYDLSSYTPERLAWEFNHVADRIEAKDFVPTFEACDYCGVRRWCAFVGGADASSVPLPYPVFRAQVS